jgi:hypothetical protein
MEVWMQYGTTSRFIVDTFRYISHGATDYLCQTYCCPSPGDGSAPNLVTIEYDNNGCPHAKRAFNTQVCEQLNASLGGFEPILKCMKPGNFNWFLHAMLFYQTKHVIMQQKQKAKHQRNDDDNEDLGLDEEPVESGISDQSLKLQINKKFDDFVQYCDLSMQASIFWIVN